MKRIVWLFGLICMLISFAAAQRLPEVAAPENYKLTFTPNFEKNNFTGDETIQIRILKPTPEVVLNAADIEFHEVTITSGGATQAAAVKPEDEIAKLSVSKPLAPGPATIHIRYTGILNDQMRGFYLGKLEGGKKYAATQFEATDARRAFPSFDEPAYKATFDITVIADKGRVAISNYRAISDEPGPGADQHTVRFATTAKMSSYLVAFAVGDFEFIEGEADGIPIRVYTPPGKKQLATFALATSEQCIKYFDHYFGIKYPFEKLDEIALPDFSAGAMENTGFITYREIDLLLNDGQASVDDHKNVATTISHEIAHQWFGDLVTMQWWDDIWLNEGFATWMESKPIEAWKPEWNLQLDDTLDTGASLNVDALANTRPIHQAADTPEQISELFDGIAYGKSAAVLRMLEAYLGPEDFRAGVNQYLKQHSYGNATAEDFWGALAAASKKPVDRVMPTFVTQAGAPMVTVQTQCLGDKTNVTLSQQRYFYSRSLFDAGSHELWMVPVCMKSVPDASGKTTEQCELLTQKQQSFTLPGCAAWVMANAGATGYYRSGYGPDAIRAMSRVMQKDFTPAERIRLLTDEWASMRVGRQDIGDFLALASGFREERSRAVVEELTAELEYTGDNFVTDADRQGYQQWVRDLFSPLAKELGWQPAAGESDEQKSLRALVMRTLGYTGQDPEVLAEARRLAEKALDDPSSLDRTMAHIVFGLAVLNGDAALYDRIMAQTKKATSPEEYYLYQATLSEFGDPKLLQKTLDYALTSEVRSQDTVRVIARVMNNSAGQKLGWAFAREHWPQIASTFGGFGGGGIVGATSAFCDAGMRDEVKDFFTSHQVPAAERSLKQALERVSYCADLKAQQSGQLASWLQHHGSAAAQ
jgi:aminopeptidase N